MAVLGDNAVLVVLVVALAVALVGWWRAHTRMRRGNARRHRAAMHGEDRADAVLEAYGFTVLEHQVTARFLLVIDGEEVWVDNRVDRLVERDGQLYVADVKTGDRARDPTTPATRRQLLEYLLVHEADGALVVDMEAEVVVEVGFDGLIS